MANAIEPNANIVEILMVQLINDINSGAEMEKIKENTEVLLYNILCINELNRNFSKEEKYDYISILYRFIFYTYEKKSSLVSLNILSGFLDFGKNIEGSQYKQLLDDLMIKAFDFIVDKYGWSILEEFMITMKKNIDRFEDEPLFNHIINTIIMQLKNDEKVLTNSDHKLRNTISNISYYLPREKSFKWGWFSYYIAYAHQSHHQDQPQTKRLFSKSLMKYRKLISLLRTKTSLCVLKNDKNNNSGSTLFDVIINDNNIIDQKWNIICSLLNNEYCKWVNELMSRERFISICNSSRSQAPSPSPSPSPKEDNIKNDITITDSETDNVIEKKLSNGYGLLKWIWG